MHIKNILCLAIALLLLQTSCSQNKAVPGNPSGPHYLVHIDKDHIREIKVEATLPLVRDTLYMSQSDDAPLKNGYAGFVSDLKATDVGGRAIVLTPIGKGMWKVNTHIPASIKLKYNVEVRHDSVAWTTSSAFARAYSVDNVVFFAGRCVFIAAAGSDSAKITVQYDIPKDWDIATPYTGLDESAHTFEARDLNQLWHNGNFIGQFTKKEINVGELQVAIAGTPLMKEGVDLFQSALSKIINSYKTDMDGAPEGKLVIMASVSPLSQGGESFPNSISLMFNRIPDMGNKNFWGYLLAHEIFHLWNGHAIYSNDQPKVEWFVEGFTEYMSMLTAYRTGLNSEQEYMKQWAYCRSVYLAKAGKISLMDAGLHKGANYDLIYNGGMSVALALDMEIRRATHNKKGAIDVLKAMYADFGKTNRAYTYDDIVRISGEVSGTDLSGFFGDYVAGTKIIPLDQYFATAGLETGNGTIVPKANATAGEKSLFYALLYKQPLKSQP